MGMKIGDRLGNAVFIGDYEANTPEWHELRDSGIGGSDVAAIVGVSPWESAYALWAKKCKLIPNNFEPSEAMEWGNLLEPVIAAKFASKHPELTMLPTGTFRSVEREFQVVNPDGIFQDADGNYGILEIKTSGYEDDWKNGVPRYYQTQVQWYLQAFGFKKAIVAVLFGGRKYVEYELLADEFQQEVNLEEVERFLGYVKNQIKPDWDGSTATYEAIRAIHPDIEDSEIDLGDIAVHLLNAKTNFEQAEKHYQMMKSIALDNMGTAKYGIYEHEDGTIQKVCYRTAKKFGLPYLVMK